MAKKQQEVDKETGLVEEASLNEVLEIHTTRANGTTRIQLDFQYCPTMAEQHTAHLTDINYLMETYQPDELAAYLAARNSHRQAIEGWDFSQEPDSTTAFNMVSNLKKAYDELSDDVKMHFKNHVEFLKFIDNPANAEKMIKLGLMTKREVQNNTTLNPESTQVNSGGKKDEQKTESTKTV